MANSISVRKLVRFDNWWNSKMPLLLTIAYFCIYFTALPFKDALPKLAILLVWLIAAAASGHVINDWFDIQIDRNAGKTNAISNLTPANRYLVLTILLLLAAVPIYLLSNYRVLLLVCLQQILFILYSQHTWRLKEQPLAGIITDMFYAYVIPAIIIVMYFRAEGSISGLLKITMLGWLICQGLRNILLHQVSDYETDAISDVKTFAVTYGKQNTLTLINFALVLLEVVSLLMWTAIVSMYFFSWLLPAVLLFALIKGVVEYQYWATEKSWKSAAHPTFSLLNNLYEEVLPLAVLFALGRSNYLFFFLLLIHIFLFKSNAYNLIAAIRAFIYYFRTKGQKPST